MNISIDTTIIFLLLGIGYSFTLILFIAYEHKQIKKLRTNTFFLAKCMQAFAWFFLIFRGGNLEYLGIVFANSLLFISYACEVIALLELKQPLHKKLKIRYLIFTIVSIIGFHLIFIFYNYESIRIAYYGIVNAAIYMSIYQIVYGKRSTPLMKIIGSMYILFAISSLIRGYIAITTSASSGSLFNPGTSQWIFSLFMFIFSSFGTIGYILLKKEKVDAELFRFASYDDLTDILNRRTFTEQAELHINRCAKKNDYVSYLLFDIDYFKEINDSLGHHIGDKVLQDLTMQIKLQLDKDDLFGRYGGDEFGILLPCKDTDESNKIAEQIKQSINDAMERGLPIPYSISMGIVTVLPDSSTQLETLYKNCDKALYMAKSNGRNRIFRRQLEELEV